MAFQGLKKIIGSVVLFVCVGCSLSAEHLLFKVGDSASYVVTEKVDALVEIVHDKNYGQRAEGQSTLAFDVKVVSSNQETLSYPFTVQVTLKQISLDETQVLTVEGSDVPGKIVTKFDTANIKKSENCKGGVQLASLINKPLRFKVTETDVKEVTGKLEAAYAKLEYHSFTQVIKIEELLAQLFHLSGQDLEVSQSYPVSNVKTVSFEDEEEGKVEVVFTIHDLYTVTDKDSQYIGATWQNEVEITGMEITPDFAAAGQGSTIWEIENPVRQARRITWGAEGAGPQMKIKINSVQTWLPTTR